MISKGIRLKNENSTFVTITIKDVLKQVVDGEKYMWSILFLDGVGSPKELSNLELREKIRISKKGYILSWNKLNEFIKAINPIYWIKLIACLEESKIAKYDSDKELYETVDIFIELFDSSYWEIFTKDPQFYNNLTKRFSVEKYLDTDFQEKQ